MKSLTIAVTGLNRGENPQPGYAVVRSLRRHYPEAKIIGLAYDAMESGLFAEDGPDWSYTLPYPTVGTKALLERIDYILDRHPVNVLIPTLDAEIEPMIRIRGELSARGIHTMLPSAEAFRARAKPVLNELCERCECGTPKTVSVWDEASATRTAGELGFPLMVKGQFYDAKRAADAGEVRGAFSEIARVWGLPILLQQCVTGDEYNVLGLGDGTGEVSGLCCVRKTIISSKGKALGAVTVREPRLESLARRVISHLKWEGPFELELIHDREADDFVMIEMNPRFPAWADFPSNYGLNFPARVVQMIHREILEPARVLPPGLFYIRHQTELTGSMAELAPLLTAGVWHNTRSRS